MNDMTSDPLYEAVQQAIHHLPVVKGAELVARRLTALERQPPPAVPTNLDAELR